MSFNIIQYHSILFSHFPSVELSGKLPKWENSIPTSQYPTVDTNRHFRFDSLAFWHIWHSGVTESCAAATIGKAMQCHGLIQFVLFQSFSIYFSLPPFLNHHPPPSTVANLVFAVRETAPRRINAVQVTKASIVDSVFLDIFRWLGERIS